jgi:hypothetical protein
MASLQFFHLIFPYCQALLHTNEIVPSEGPLNRPQGKVIEK